MNFSFASSKKQLNVVDSCGWIAYFKDEANALFFDDPLNNTKQLIVPALSIFEVCKNVLITRGEAAAQLAMETMQQGRVVHLEPAQLLDAAQTSKTHGLHVGDAIIWQTAHVYGAKLYTQDTGLSKMPNVLFKSKTP